MKVKAIKKEAIDVSFLKTENENLKLALGLEKIKIKKRTVSQSQK